MPNPTEPRPVAVLGGGPAGLTAAYDLAKRERAAVLFEADDTVGGLARTVERDGYRFDLGGHRFFTKNREVEALWREVLGPELLTRPRLSRIRWRGRFVEYPLRIGDVVRKVGPVELMRCSASYAVAAARPNGDAETFEEWVSSRFGKRLFDLFFRSYTEKVWGVPTGELRAEWAAQRIRELSLGRAVRAAVLRDGNEVHSLIGEFLYPRLGPGQMWETMLAETVRMGGDVRLATPVTGLRHQGGAVRSVTAGDTEVDPAAVISSVPLGAIVEMLDPPPPTQVREAASGLRYRDFLTVALVVRGEDLFPDNWVYVHDPEVRVGRIQNFRSWSPWMVPDDDRTCVGLEYFCFEGDETWSAPDDDLVELAAAELERTGLAPRGAVERGWVVRVPKAYPIYDADYGRRVRVIRAWLESLENLQQIGRNGLHRYNNVDHSMLTALRAVDNVLGAGSHDIWAVNAESVYHETANGDEHPYLRAPEPPALREQRPVA